MVENEIVFSILGQNEVQFLRFSERIFPGSSMVEHPAVNGQVESSSLSQGAK